MGHLDSTFPSNGAASSDICNPDFDSSTDFSILRADEGTVTKSGNKISASLLFLPTLYENFVLFFATIFNPFSVCIVAPRDKSELGRQ